MSLISRTKFQFKKNFANRSADSGTKNRLRSSSIRISNVGIQSVSIEKGFRFKTSASPVHLQCILRRSRRLFSSTAWRVRESACCFSLGSVCALIRRNGCHLKLEVRGSRFLTSQNGLLSPRFCGVSILAQWYPRNCLQNCLIDCVYSWVRSETLFWSISTTVFEKILFSKNHWKHQLMTVIRYLTARFLQRYGRWS